MMREARKHYDIGTFLDGVAWAYEHPKSYTIAEYLYKEKGYPISLNGDIPTYEEVIKNVQIYNNDKMRQMIEKACNGLESTPNLESLWHDASEEPLLEKKEIIFLNEQDIAYVTERFGGTFSFMLKDFNWERFVNLLKISKWAYISDLLPKQFGNSKQLKGGKNE